jgi:hypothetical protein
MTTLKLNAWERLMLTRSLPQGGTLQQIAVYLRILEVLRLKEDEREAVGWQENPDAGTVTIQGATHEFDVALEDADFTTLHELATQWNGWPTAPESLTLMAKLDVAK